MYREKHPEVVWTRTTNAGEQITKKVFQSTPAMEAHNVKVNDVLDEEGDGNATTACS